MTIESTVIGISNRVFNNALKAKFRDPSRSIRLLDFMTLHERQILLFTSTGDALYEEWLDEGD